MEEEKEYRLTTCNFPEFVLKINFIHHFIAAESSRMGSRSASSHSSMIAQ